MTQWGDKKTAGADASTSVISGLAPKAPELESMMPPPADRLVNPADLAGVSEIADLLDRHIRVVYQWVERPDFPSPVVRLGKKTRLYLMTEVRAWFASRPVRRPRLDHTAPEHGLAGYRARGCRCTTCTLANRTYHREYGRERRTRQRAERGE